MGLTCIVAVVWPSFSWQVLD